jgi:hypothetical protein
MALYPMGLGQARMAMQDQPLPLAFGGRPAVVPPAAAPGTTFGGRAAMMPPVAPPIGGMMAAGSPQQFGGRPAMVPSPDNLAGQQFGGSAPVTPPRRGLAPGPLQRTPMRGTQRFAPPPQVPMRGGVGIVDPAQEAMRGMQALARMRTLAGIQPMPLRVAGMPQTVAQVEERGNQ